MMRILLIACALAVAMPLTASAASAQEIHQFASGGILSDVNEQVYPTASYGATIDVLTGWVSAGGFVDAMFSLPYAAARGGVLLQGNVVHTRSTRVFATAGQAWGEEAGPMVGAGFEVFPRARVGLRVMALDYINRIERFDCGRYGNVCVPGEGQTSTMHAPTVQIGVVWR